LPFYLGNRYTPPRNSPYNVLAVKLDEGPLMTSNMVGCRNDDIRCDMPMEVFFDNVTELITLAKFRPADSAKPNN